MPRTKRLHFKDLDALRFFAFLPIFLFCVLYLSRTENEGFHHELTNATSLIKQNSLDFFFFLSAFLLTSQALREYKYNESFALKSFYARRILRIAPLFFVGLVFTFLIHPWVLKTLKLNAIAIPSSSSYFFLFPNYFSNYTQEQYIYLAVIWTIYMFIQFYIVWGIALKYFRHQLKTIAIISIAIGIAARITHYFMEHYFEFDTLSYGVPIGMGALLAVMIRNDSPMLEPVKLLPKRAIVAIYIVGSMVVVGGYLISDHFLVSSLVPVVTCIFFSIVIVEQTFGKNSFVKFRDQKLVSHLGKISYGFILYQAIINVLIVTAIDSLDFDISSISVRIMFLLVSFVLSWVVADLSYNFYEKPLLRLRREFKKI